MKQIRTKVLEMTQSGHLEMTQERPRMKYFRKVTEIQCLEEQRIKRRSLEKLILSKRKIKGEQPEEFSKERSAKMVELIKSQKSTVKGLKTFSLPICNLITDKHFPSLVYPIQKQLKKFSFEFNSWTTKVGEQGKRLLESRIKYGLKQLQKLSVYFQGPPDFQMFFILYQMLFTPKALKELDLNLLQSSNLTDQEFSFIARNLLSRQKLLQNLRLRFSSNEFGHDVTDKGLSEFAYQIGTNLKQLRQLDLEFSRWRRFGLEGVQAFATELASNLTQLQKFSLDFFDCGNTSDQKIPALANQIGRIKSLQSLSLNFSTKTTVCCMPDQAVIELATQIGQNLERIKELNLAFQNCDLLSDEGVEALAFQIGHNLKNLEFLNLNLSNCGHITDKGFTSLFTQIGSSSSQLQGLTLNLSRNDAIDQDIQLLASQLKNNQKELQCLSLNFSGFENITNEAFQVFSTEICNLKKLQQLTLKFSILSQVTNEGIITLATQIGRNLKQLQQLNLQLVSCLNLNDNGLIALANQTGQNLKQLRGLHCNFSLSSVTDHGLAVLATQIGSNLKQLQQVELYFQGCSGITQDGESNFSAQIKAGLKQLQKFYFDRELSWM